MGLPFLPFAGPALFTPSYELVSRMAAAAPAARAAPRLSFVGRLSLLRCCLAPGDSALFPLFLGLPVEGGVATTDGLSFDRNRKPVLPVDQHRSASSAHSAIQHLYSPAVHREYRKTHIRSSAERFTLRGHPTHYKTK